MIALVVAFTAGLILGLFYFGGLWLSVKRLATVRRPALWMMTSLIGRTVVVVAGFYLLMDGQWERLIAALLGFIAMRTVLLRSVRSTAAEAP